MFGDPRSTVAAGMTDKTIMSGCRQHADVTIHGVGARRRAGNRDRLRGEILATHQAGRPHENLLTAGQAAGGIKEILPVAEIMQRLVAETEAALSRAVDFAESAAPGARFTGPTGSFVWP
jgi:NAD(P)H-dependent flavin oxidoreductase YrpB (nitropropane dioxygenase family)